MEDSPQSLRCLLRCHIHTPPSKVLRMNEHTLWVLCDHTTYLPGSQGDQTRVFAKRTFLHFMHKLRQLGVSAAAVVNLQ